MSSEDNGTEMSEMRGDVDTVQGDPAEGVPEVQESFVAYPQEEETMRFRVRMYTFGSSPKDTLYLEYFYGYDDALKVYNEICDDWRFIEAYGKFAMVEVEEGHVGRGEIFWETVLKSMLYDESKLPPVGMSRAD